MMHIISNMINQIQTRYRRAQDVKFFDEIIEEWINNGCDNF